MSELGFAMRFAVAVLATWRMTHLLAGEDGPADLIVRLRRALGNGFAGRLMDCFYCLSFWTAALAALFVTRRPVDWLWVWLAISGGACLLERLAPQPIVIEPVNQSLQEVEDVLRPKENAGEQHLGPRLHKQ
jgi:hypothetical protein